MNEEIEALLKASRAELAQARRNVGVAWQNIEEIKLILARSEQRANLSPEK